MAFVPAPGYQPTYNPTLPYNRPIPGGLSVGMSVYIQGVPSEHMRRFFVNFMVGQSPESDVAFHFNPRFDGLDKVVFNAKQGGQHRLPLQMVTHLQVDGDVQLQSINFIGGQPPPHQGPPGHGHHHQNVLPTMEGPPAFNPMVGPHALFPQPVPFMRRLQGGLTPRRTIIIKGFVPPTSRRFVINFKAGSSGDVALHINPRLAEGVVVRNSFLNGSWGSEERKLSHNPFGAGQFFDLSIRCGTDRFKVYVNGQHLFDFSHRFPDFQRVDVLEIQGDVTLSYVQV
ncbi:hypothetical protein HPG69_015606 [Diceros bicornis minor]|uniref:Galectin n=1 Tax=Diceros bicornis minor TaxID=77932 RepID=A0A7J7FES4_DICBM|nr:hypothetical protein HPG69_015606 [Diceros bicornis minor]